MLTALKVLINLNYLITETGITKMKKASVVIIILFCLAGMISAQSKFGVSVQGAVSSLTGSNSSDWNKGFGGIGTFSLNLSKNLDLAGTISYLTYTAKYNSDETVSNVQIMGGIRYYFADSDFRPYITAQTGVFFSTGKGNMPGRTYSTLSALGFSGGAGFVYKLSDKLNFDLTASINTGSNDFFILAAGVNFLL